MEIDLQNGLFMCPVYYECDPCDANGLPLPLDEPDYLLHFTGNAAAMLNNGSRLYCLDDLPAECTPAKESPGGLMHFRKIAAPDGREYLPLFMHYQAMTAILGDKLHIGIVSFADLRQFCITESSIAGIVVGPGPVNRILTREMLIQGF